jgi:hypothetical protein
MKNDPAPPPAPDPTQTANAQSNANIQTAIANARLNRVNQQTPWGSITYEQGTPDANGVPTWSSHIQLSPEQQQLLTQQQQMQLQRNGMAGQFLGQVPTAPLDFGSLPGVNVRGQMWNGNTPHAAPLLLVVRCRPAAGCRMPECRHRRLAACWKRFARNSAAEAPAASRPRRRRWLLLPERRRLPRTGNRLRRTP